MFLKATAARILRLQQHHHHMIGKAVPQPHPQAAMPRSEQGSAAVLLQVAAGHLSTYCAFCGGSLQNTFPQTRFRTGLMVVRNLAEYHGFPDLKEMTNWLLDPASSDTTGS
jgi:hypothetical protein